MTVSDRRNRGGRKTNSGAINLKRALEEETALTKHRINDCFPSKTQTNLLITTTCCLSLFLFLKSCATRAISRYLSNLRRLLCLPSAGDSAEELTPAWREPVTQASAADCVLALLFYFIFYSLTKSLTTLFFESEQKSSFLQHHHFLHQCNKRLFTMIWTMWVVVEQPRFCTTRVA